MKERVYIIIPARAASERLPNKPLREIKGVAMLLRVIRLAKAAQIDAEIIVATESDTIASKAREWGVSCVITSQSCNSGTERVAEALKQLSISSGVVLNLQGDAPLTPPWVIKELLVQMLNDKDANIATAAVALDDNGLKTLLAGKVNSPSSGTTVVMDIEGNALYFSKQVIPFKRSTNTAAPILRHIGIYAYRVPFLFKYLELSPTPLEKTEKLEQLRVLEHGYKLRVILVDYQGRTHASVDSESDIRIVEDIIEKEGELVKDI